ncbi:MAG: hypothetical protein QME32_02340 [Endomicrobiia bacterium]|nr:hypothetical protein [Endomicrobiia bacterium]
MNHEEKILSFVGALKKRFALVAAAHFAVDFAIICVGIFFLAVLAAAYLNISGNSFAPAATAQALLCAYLVVKYALFVAPRFNAPRLIRMHERRHPALSDDFSTAYSLIVRPDGRSASDLLVAAHIKRTASLLGRTAPSESLPSGLSPKLLRLTACLILAASFRFAYPIKFRAASRALSLTMLSQEELRVSPGDTRVIFGRPVMLSATLAAEARERPRLYVSTHGRKFAQLGLEGVESPHSLVWTKEIAAVYENIGYYFALGSARTKEYTLIVEQPAVFESFKIRYDYPAYTQSPPRVVENNPNIECNEGARVSITAYSSRPLDSAAMTTGARALEMRLDKTGRAATLSFAPRSSGRYKFLTVAGGNEFFSGEYGIEIKNDESPSVEIISPARDIVAGGDEKIPVVFVCEDDFGVISAKFHLRAGDAVEDIRLLTPSPDSTTVETSRRKWISEYELDLKKIKASPAAGVRYSVSAEDAAGNTGRSKAYFIEIFSYEKSHDEIMLELEHLATEALDILSAQTAARASVDKEKTPPWDAVASEQRGIKSATEKLSSKLSSTLEKMSADPYFDGYLMKEYSGMRDDLDALSAKTLSAAVAAAASKDRNHLLDEQARAITALENIAILSADVIKNQRYADIESDFLVMERRFDSALESLEAGNAESMNAELAEISRIMGEIENLMREMPQLLPEEFVNSDAARDMDFPSAKGLLEEIRAAAAKGDLKSAARAMSNMKEELVKMRDLLKKASANLSARSRPQEAAAIMSRVSGEIAQIVRLQGEILSSTERVTSNRRARVIREQEGALNALAVQQSAIVGRARALSAAGVSGAAGPVPLMEKIQGEFSDGKVRHAQKFLEDVIAQYPGVVSWLESSTRHSKETDIKTARSIMAEEKEISDLLKTRPDVPLTAGEKKTATADAARQEDLKVRLAASRSALAKLARETAVVSYDTLENMSEASGEMALSSENLARFNPDSSAKNQKRVIEILSSSSENLSNAASGMGASSFGSRPAPSIRASSPMPAQGMSGAPSGSSGFAGARVEHVELPGAKDYKVPPAFREEILKYLRERHPENYEELIKKYYRRLVE